MSIAAVLPGLARATLTVGERTVQGNALVQAVGGVAARVGSAQRVAVWATPSLDTCVAVAGVLAAGATAIPLDPRAAPAELAFVIDDCHPQLVVAAADAILPPPVGGLPRADAMVGPAELPDVAPDPEDAALLMYTSGTTGPPKGVLVSRRAVAACLDGLVDAWSWTPADVLAHALPLFHVHGLVLGVLGPLRVGGTLRHPGAFSTGAVCRAGATMVFGVPTMWSRIAADADAARALAGARLLVSGSAGLPRPVYDAILALTGHGLVERYGLTEALIVAAARADEPRVPGRVGTPLPHVGLRLSDVAEGMGEIELAGPTVFSGYYGRPDATRAVMTADGWLRTGDLGTLDPDGGLRIVGRRATDLIMTGGHRVGAGEVEAALLAHPGVAEAAVIGVPDDDLGERVVAFVVVGGAVGGTVDGVDSAALDAHAAGLLAPYKRPREIRLVEALPRNAMGKVLKHVLRR